MSRPHPMRDAGLALSLMTAIPVPVRQPEDGRTQVAGWFGVVGGLFGVAGYAVMKVAERFGALERAPFVIAALVVCLWALLSRLLHWDGLADVADGFWGSHDAARRLEIMSDRRTGAFGATAVALAAVLEIAAIGSFVLMHQSPVLAVPVFARFAATAAAWLGTPAREGGLGRSVMGRPSVGAVVVSALALALAGGVLWVGLGWTGLALGFLGVALALVVPHVIALRFGGVTGDVMGASVLITEVLLFAAFALVV
jgi:adenosylcobinamide-GDP ribazoletransferase